jgi:hypothetical protein
MLENKKTFKIHICISESDLDKQNIHLDHLNEFYTMVE